MNSRSSRAGWRAAGLCLALTLLLLTAGCSSNGSVTGTVTFDGKPMPGGTITFVAESGGGGASGEINPKDGTYSIAKLPKGKMKVAVKPYQPPKMGGGPMGGPPGMGRGGPPGMRGEGGAPKGAQLPEGVDPSIFNPGSKAEGAKAVNVPEKYTDPEKSGLTATIGGGKNTVNIDVPKE